MYIETIELINSLNDKKLCELKEFADNAYNNRVGKVSNSSKDKYIIQFKSDKRSDYGTFGLGALAIYHNKDFIKYISKWTYVDTLAPGDNSNDVLSDFIRGEKLCLKNK